MQILNRSHAALTLLRASSRRRAPVPRWTGIASAAAGAMAAAFAGLAVTFVLLPPALVTFAYALIAAVIEELSYLLGGEE